MHTIDTENQFIELRAKGLSLSRIATQIKVSQRTLVDWNRKHHAQIQDLRSIAFEAMKERILLSQEQELTILSNHLQRIEKELTQRTLRFVPIPALFRVCALLRAEIHKTTLLPDPLPPLEPEPQKSPEETDPIPPHKASKPNESVSAPFLPHFSEKTLSQRQTTPENQLCAAPECTHPDAQPHQDP